MFRRLRVLAAFFMVPVVLVGTASSASAVNGPWATASITVYTPLVDDAAPGVNCQFSLQQAPDALAIRVGVNGRCIGLPDVSPGFAQDGEAGSTVTTSVTGMTDSGAGCSASTTTTLAQHAANGTLRVAGTILGHLLNVGVDDCSLSEVCISLRGSEPECIPFDLAAIDSEPEPSGDACSMGTPSAIVSVEHDGQTPNQINYDRVYLEWHLNGSPPVSTAQWGAHISTIGGTGGTSKVITTNQKILLSEKPRWGTDPVWSPTPGWGIEVYAYFTGPGGSEVSCNNVPIDSFAGLVPTQPPTAKNQAYFGITDPGHCRFYFGPKVVNFSNTDIDEPAGDGVEPVIVTPPPPPTPEPPVETPDPEDDDTNWLARIWSALISILGAVRALVSALVGLAADIVDGIVGALQGLFDDMFVPDDEFLNQRYSNVRNQWEDTTPGKFAEALGSFNAGGASGCSGIPLNVDLPGGVAINQSIGAACSGPMASAAGVTRAVLSAVIVVSGILACVRAVGSGLGWNPGIGRQGGAA